MYFLIDYENVNYAGLEGTEFLRKDDTVSFFFSDKSDKIVAYRMKDIERAGCAFEICKFTGDKDYRFRINWLNVRQLQGQ